MRDKERKMRPENYIKIIETKHECKWCDKHRDALLELFKIADKLKTFGDYDKANEIFVFLLWNVIHDSKLRINVLLETQDERGESFGEAFYDLLVLEMENRKINIPMPLLKATAVITTMKRKRITPVERESHNRKNKTPCDGEVESLHKEVNEIFKCFYEANRSYKGLLLP